ncbi:MAG: hypothetical protein AB8B95_01875 [Pseudohongiellaceae bacterium]
MKTLAIYALLVSLTFIPTSLSAQEKRQQTNVANGVPSEIIVTPYSNMNRRSIRALISKTEEEFINRFNELNLDEDYDIDCYRYTSSSSHFKQKICEPKFFKAARSADASLATFNLLQATTVHQLESVQVQSDQSLRSGLQGKYSELQLKVRAFANSDNALQDLLIKLMDLNSSLENFNKND